MTEILELRISLSTNRRIIRAVKKWNNLEGTPA
jgi:hypothetical protein